MKPLVENVNTKLERQIKDGEVKIADENLNDAEAKHMKILQDYRLRKLKTALSTIRNEMLKRDFQERSKEI